ncbi:MAG: hypothetical protein GY805_24275 [Chloroflexi bacterium]|nr:hypothetical protein [Chloroflexota bacterium]
MIKRIAIALSILLLTSACGGSGSSHMPQDVIDAFQSADLEAESPTVMTADDYGLAPFVGDGIRFLIPSLGEGNGGRVVAFEDADDRDRLAAYFESLGESSALFFSWVFVKDNIVLQINGSLDEDIARQYEAALNGLE